MLEHEDIIDKPVGDVLMLGAVGVDSYREFYWNPKGNQDSCGLVLARGDEAVSTLREAMMMLRSDDSVTEDMLLVDENSSKKSVKPGQSFDAPATNHSAQRDPDLDAILSAISDMARTYPDSPDECRAVHEAQSICAMPDEKLAKVLVATLILIDALGVTLRDVARYASNRNRPAWILRHLVDELDRRR